MLMRKILDLFRRPEEPKHTMEDEFLGTLTWEEKYHWWRGTMTLADGNTTRFLIDGKKTDEAIAEADRNIIKFLITNEPLIRRKIAVSACEIYNGTWSGGDDTITPEEMAQRIALKSVSISGEGGGELDYEAADGLFTDHTISTPFDANGELGESDLEG